MTDLVSAPAAARNADAILNALGPVLPLRGQVLEIASGTGQHIAAFAAAYPDLDWQPSDVTEARFAAVEGWRAAVARPNLAPPIVLDACRGGWAALHGPVDVVFAVNLLHLISDAQMAVFLDETARALAPGGLCAIYGPFLRDGRTTSDGDTAFHASLQAQDPAIGYKEIEVLRSVFHALEFSVEVMAMPANNLLVIARKSGLA